MTGLLQVAQDTFPPMRKGFYGLRVILMMGVFMALLREPRAEGATRLRPQDLGRLLGLDRAPEVKTGLLPVAQDAAEGLYRLVDAAYEKRSVAISSNLHPAAFDELMPKTLATATATATVDRLLHHAHVCQTTGESVRLSQALAGAGVVPLGGGTR